MENISGGECAEQILGEFIGQGLNRKGLLASFRDEQAYFWKALIINTID